MTYDQWKTTDPRDYEPEAEEQPTELELLCEQLREAEADAKHVRIIAQARIAELKDALEEALAYFKDQYDVIDGFEGEQLPNKEMRLGMMIDEALYGIRF